MNKYKSTFPTIPNKSPKISHIIFVTWVLCWLDDFSEGNIYEFLIHLTALCRDGIVWHK